MNSDISSIFKEKKWENGENSTDGYVLRGKRAFDKVLEGLKGSMIKGYHGNINGLEFKVLDSRVKGVELEIEIEMIDNKKKGVAMLKLYGPNKKKESVVTVSRSKGNDVEFIHMLRDKILQPLMEEFLKGGGTENVKEESNYPDNVEEKIVKLYKCPKCDKTSNSMPGLKGHMTKMHHGMLKATDVISTVNPVESIRDIDQSEVPKEQHEIIISKEANEVVSHLLSDMIYLVDDGDSDVDSTVTLEEMCDDDGIKRKKEYSNACDECDLRIVASKKYVALQLLKNHKNEYHTKACSDCDYKARSKQEMRRHMRDVHGVITGSTSPPSKKKKCDVNDTSEMMDVDNVSNISLQLEEMDIEITENQDEDTPAKRSARVDEKIMKKQDRLEEEERKRKESKKKVEVKKTNEKLVQLGNQRKERKLRKQKSKSVKKQVKNTKKIILPVVSKVPNLKDVPAGCRQHVNDGDLVYVVPGDGACCPNCAAAFFFQDEVFGPKLRMRMNEFFVKHWKRKYKTLCPCSTEEPFVRKTQNGEISYTEPEELFKYLLSTDKGAEYMWSDSIDIVVIADMYQVNIKVITIKSWNDDKPSVTWINADKAMENFAELKNVKQNDMVLLHEDDSHYNLIVPKQSDLAQLGSLSYRFNVGPVMRDTIDADEIKDDAAVEPNELSEKDLKKELKKCLNEKRTMQLEYFNCEKELKKKTEEAEILKSELKDLKEMIKLENLLKEDDDDQGEKNKEEEEVLLRMKNAGFQRKSPQYDSILKRAATKSRQVEKEIQYNCYECDYQGTRETDLNKHLSLKHRGNKNDGAIKCRNCGELFNTKWSLMTHRKDKHLSSVAYCKNYAEGTCVYSENMCWWNHSEKSNVSGDKINCYVCNKAFDSKKHLMIHRKDEHAQLIRPCSQFQSNNCRYLSSVCWYTHEEDNVDKTKTKTTIEEETMETESVFQKVKENLEPPLTNKQETERN